MNEPLDLDAIEARINKVYFVGDGSFQHRDLLALIAEVRRLRAMLESAIEEIQSFDELGQFNLTKEEILSKLEDITRG